MAAQGEKRNAESLLGALLADADVDVRCEARFRIGLLREGRRDWKGAAAMYRAVLDEKPKATPVRLQLAKVLAEDGDEEAAGRQLRRASTSGLPEDVAQVIDQFQLALRSRRRLGGSFELGFAPDSNINRANGNATVTIGSQPLDLSRDARARSGLGATIGSQVFWRPALGRRTNMLLTASGSADLYRRSQFNDIGLTATAGPELLRGRSRFRPSAIIARRWFGGAPYSESYGGALNWLRQINPVSQVQLDLTNVQTVYKINPSLTGRAASVVARYERAVSPRFFGRLSARVDRQDARDPAFATWSAGGEILASRDVGRRTIYLRAGLYKTRGDAAFTLPRAKRRDGLIDVEVGLSFRDLAVLGLAPVIRLHRTENHSPIFFYDFRRTRLELGITHAF
jgi:hypothetical protein